MPCASTYLGVRLSASRCTLCYTVTSSLRIVSMRVPLNSHGFSLNIPAQCGTFTGTCQLPIRIPDVKSTEVRVLDASECSQKSTEAFTSTCLICYVVRYATLQFPRVSDYLLTFTRPHRFSYACSLRYLLR